jgi:hypothetical protein
MLSFACLEQILANWFTTAGGAFMSGFADKMPARKGLRCDTCLTESLRLTESPRGSE